MTESTLSTRADSIQKANAIYATLRRTAPKNKRDLKNYVKVFLGIDVPDKKICDDHNAPLDYLWHSFSADFAAETRPNADAVVWANRAGGKTKLAAVATLLDCIFKPNCQVRILAGSGEQAGRMYDYVTAFLRNGFEPFLLEPIRRGKCRFVNGSTVEVLTQSAASVRGQHINKLRCDEVELFHERVFAAAKFTTRTTAGMLAAMESISTMHRPYGLMQRIVASAEHTGTPLFKWCLWEVIEKCTDRSCSQCPLNSDCRARAKQADGYLKIDDAITAMRRASRAAWESEMLCRRPSRENTVFDEFDPAVHVKYVDYDPNLPLYRSLDFGFVNPFVCLWIQLDSDGVVRVIDEYVRSRATIDIHAAYIKQRTPGGEQRVTATFCDPAGGSVNDVTGTSVVRELRALGIRTRYKRSGIVEGIELIRRAVRAGDGKSRLLISPRCPRLIEAMQCYHYPESGAPSELPLKDVLYDHPIDALRYFFINQNRCAPAQSRRY
jgi:hypothetical protein